jgi:hypothetical protein
MEYQIKFKENFCQKVFNKTLALKFNARHDFFSDIRRVFKGELEELLSEQHIQGRKGTSLGNTNLLFGKVRNANAIDIRNEMLDTEFCSKYGHDNYSMQAINWYTDHSKFPSLISFSKVKDFSIGNIAVLVKNGDYDIKIVESNDIKFVGYSYNISSKKRKSYLCILGIRFDFASMQAIFGKYLHSCNCNLEDLDQFSFEAVSFPAIFICRRCGQLFTCQCFEGYFDLREDILRYLPGGLIPYGEDDELRKRASSIKIRSKICHSCTNTIPKPYYGCSSRPSIFLSMYKPYYELLIRKKYSNLIFEFNDSREKDIENELRENFGYPLVGKMWLSETALFKMVQMLFSTKEVIHHYRGRELEGLELDIWIPELKLGIEYQGEQHYKVVKQWGGKAGLQERIDRDRKKKKLMKKLGYAFIEFKYDEILTVGNVENKLKNYF